MASSVSLNGVAFTGGNEGFVSKFYKDPGGVGTIGFGFTWLSAAFRDYWMKTRGHKLRAGDTISDRFEACLGKHSSGRRSSRHFDTDPRPYIQRPFSVGLSGTL